MNNGWFKTLSVYRTSIVFIFATAAHDADSSSRIAWSTVFPRKREFRRRMVLALRDKPDPTAIWLSTNLMESTSILRYCASCTHSAVSDISTPSSYNRLPAKGNFSNEDEIKHKKVLKKIAKQRRGTTYQCSPDVVLH